MHFTALKLGKDDNDKVVWDVSTSDPSINVQALVVPRQPSGRLWTSGPLSWRKDTEVSL